MKKIDGVLLSIIVAFIATLLSQFITIGSVALAIIIGLIIGNSFKLSDRFNSGITFSEKILLAWAIALMGINLDFSILVELGMKSIILIIVALVVTIFTAIYLAKVFNFDKKFALMLGIGNGVCGSAAIAATKDIVGLDKEKTGLSVAIVNFLGTVGIFLVPLLATYILGFSDVEAGILVGNTLQAVGQVLAGGFSISEVSGQTATIVKMGRVLMLTPIVFILIFILHRNKKDEKALGKAEIPMFIIGFVLFSIIATIGIFPQMITDTIATSSHYLLLVAMSAIGLKINFKTILQHGSTALKIGSIIFVVQIVFSSLAILIFF